MQQQISPNQTLERIIIIPAKPNSTPPKNKKYKTCCCCGIICVLIIVWICTSIRDHAQPPEPIPVPSSSFNQSGFVVQIMLQGKFAYDADYGPYYEQNKHELHEFAYDKDFQITDGRVINLNIQIGTDENSIRGKLCLFDECQDFTANGEGDIIKHMFQYAINLRFFTLSTETYSIGTTLHDILRRNQHISQWSKPPIRMKRFGWQVIRARFVEFNRDSIRNPSTIMQYLSQHEITQYFPFAFSSLDTMTFFENEAGLDWGGVSQDALQLLMKQLALLLTDNGVLKDGVNDIDMKIYATVIGMNIVNHNVLMHHRFGVLKSVITAKKVNKLYFKTALMATSAERQSKQRRSYALGSLKTALLDSNTAGLVPEEFMVALRGIDFCEAEWLQVPPQSDILLKYGVGDERSCVVDAWNWIYENRLQKFGSILRGMIQKDLDFTYFRPDNRELFINEYYSHSDIPAEEIQSFIERVQDDKYWNCMDGTRKYQKYMSDWLTTLAMHPDQERLQLLFEMWHGDGSRVPIPERAQEAVYLLLTEDTDERNKAKLPKFHSCFHQLEIMKCDDETYQDFVAKMERVLRETDGSLGFL